METIPIATLSPSIEAPDNKAIRGVVTLIWPYSSSTRKVALLLAEPDFRLRSRKGQVRIQLSGASVQAVATSRIGIGDEVTLGLVGARWIEDGGGGESVRTPGKSVEGELGYGQRIAIQIKRNGEEYANLDINEPSPSPEHTTRSPVRTALSPPSLGTPAPTRANGLGNSQSWTSPAFFKHSKLSQDSLTDSPYDPFAEEDGYVEGKGRKRRRKSWKDVNVWTYSARTPSPEKDQAEAMLVDEEYIQSSSSEPKTDQAYAELLQSPVSAEAVGAQQQPATSSTGADGGIGDSQQPLGDPRQDFSNTQMDSLERTVEVATHSQSTSKIPLQSVDDMEEPELENLQIAQHVATNQSEFDKSHSLNELNNLSGGVKVNLDQQSSSQREPEYQEAITEANSENKSVRLPEDEDTTTEKQDESIGKESGYFARQSIVPLSETQEETLIKTNHTEMNTTSKVANEVDEEGGMQGTAQGPESTTPFPGAIRPLVSTIMPPPALPSLRITDVALDQGTTESQFTSTQDEAPSSPVLHPVASATLPLPSPFPGEAIGAVSSYLDYSPSSKLAEGESPTPPQDMQATQQTGLDDQDRLSSPPAGRAEDLRSEQTSHQTNSPMNERFSERFPFGLDGAFVSREAEEQPLATSSQLVQNLSSEESILRDTNTSAVDVCEGNFVSFDDRNHAQLPQASQETDMPITFVNLDAKPHEPETFDISSSEISSEETEDETESDQEEDDENLQEDGVNSWHKNFTRKEVDDDESLYSSSEDEFSETEGEEEAPTPSSDHESESSGEDPEDYESYYDRDVSDHVQSGQEVEHGVESTRPAPMVPPDFESARSVRRPFEEDTKSNANGTLLVARITGIVDLGSETSDDDQEMPDLAERMGNSRHMQQEKQWPPSIDNEEENKLPVTAKSSVKLDQDQPPETTDGRSRTAGGHPAMIKDLPQSSPVEDVSIQSADVDSRPDLMAWEQLLSPEDVATIPPQSLKSAEDLPQATEQEEHAVDHASMSAENENRSPDSQRPAEPFPSGRDHESTKVLDLTQDESSHWSSRLPLFLANSEPVVDSLHLRSSQLFQEVIRDFEDGSISSAVSLSTMDEARHGGSEVEPVDAALEGSELEAVSGSLVPQAGDDLEQDSRLDGAVTQLRDTMETLPSLNIFQPDQKAGLQSFDRVLDPVHEQHLADGSQPLSTIVAGSLSIAQSSPPLLSHPEAESETLRDDFTFADYLNQEVAYPQVPKVSKEQSSDMALDLQDRQDQVGDQPSHHNNNLLITPDPSQQVAHESRQTHVEWQLDSALPPTPSLTQMAIPDPTPEKEGDSLQPHPILAGEKEDRSAAKVRKKSLTARLSHVPKVVSEWFAPRRSSQRSSPSLESESEYNEDKVADVDTTVATQFTRNGAISGAQLRSSSPAPSPVIMASQSQSHFPSHPERLTLGFRTPMSYYTPLTQLSSHLNTPPPSNLVDILAVVARDTRPPSRAATGPKDYYTIFSITNPEYWPARLQVQVFRPWKAAIPVASKGDIVLLRGFGVKSRKGKIGLLSAEESAWCVWRLGGTDDGEVADQSDKPIWARKHGEVRDLKEREEVKGPPVEIGEEEREEVERLREWWLEVCKEKGGSPVTVDETQDLEASQVVPDMNGGNNYENM